MKRQQEEIKAQAGQVRNDWRAEESLKASEEVWSLLSSLEAPVCTNAKVGFTCQAKGQEDRFL